jgi:HEPN domain-containing protein
MSAPHSAVLEWVSLADQDLGLAMLVVRQRSYPGPACYHLQQAIEKYLKAILVANGQAFPPTHDLLALHTLCAAAGVGVAVARPDLVRLTRLGVGVRYPGFAPLPSLTEARRAILIAGRVRRQCRRHLGLP